MLLNSRKSQIIFLKVLDSSLLLQFYNRLDKERIIFHSCEFYVTENVMKLQPECDSSLQNIMQL